MFNTEKENFIFIPEYLFVKYIAYQAEQIIYFWHIVCTARMIQNVQNKHIQEKHHCSRPFGGGYICRVFLK